MSMMRPYGKYIRKIVILHKSNYGVYYLYI